MNLINNGSLNIFSFVGDSSSDIASPVFTFPNSNVSSDIISLSFLIFGHGDCNTVGSIWGPSYFTDAGSFGMTGGDIVMNSVIRISSNGVYVPTETTIVSADDNQFNFLFINENEIGMSLTYTVQFNATKKDGSIVQRFVKMV